MPISVPQFLKLIYDTNTGQPQQGFLPKNNDKRKAKMFVILLASMCHVANGSLSKCPRWPNVRQGTI